MKYNILCKYGPYETRPYRQTHPRLRDGSSGDIAEHRVHNEGVPRHATHLVHPLQPVTDLPVADARQLHHSLQPPPRVPAAPDTREGGRQDQPGPPGGNLVHLRILHRLRAHGPGRLRPRRLLGEAGLRHHRMLRPRPRSLPPDHRGLHDGARRRLRVRALRQDQEEALQGHPRLLRRHDDRHRRGARVHRDGRDRRGPRGHRHLRPADRDDRRGLLQQAEVADRQALPGDRRHHQTNGGGSGCQQRTTSWRSPAFSA